MLDHASVYFWDTIEISPAVCIRGVDPNGLRAILVDTIEHIKVVEKGELPHPALAAAYLVSRAMEAGRVVGIVNAPLGRSVGLTLQSIEHAGNYNRGLGLAVINLGISQARLIHGPVYEDLKPDEYNQWVVREVPLPASIHQPSTEDLLAETKTINAKQLKDRGKLATESRERNRAAASKGGKASAKKRKAAKRKKHPLGMKAQTSEEKREEDALEEDALRNMGLGEAVDFGLTDTGNK